jgi:hypothetical protein
MSAGSQAMFVVEYPCDRFCRVEVDVTAERGQVTLQQLRERADGQHQGIHEPERAETAAAEAAAVAEQESSGRPAATVFLSAPGSAAGTAPGRNNGRRR